MNTKLANTGLVLLLTAAAFAAIPTATAFHPIVEPIMEIAGAGENCSNGMQCAGRPIVEPILEIGAIPDTCIRDPNACEAGRPIVEPILEISRTAPSNALHLAVFSLCSGTHLTEEEMKDCWERFCRQHPGQCTRAKPIVEPILEINSQAGDAADDPAGAPCAPPDCTDPNNPIPLGALMAILENYDVAGLEKVLGLVSPPARCIPGSMCVLL